MWLHRADGRSQTSAIYSIRLQLGVRLFLLPLQLLAVPSSREMSDVVSRGYKEKMRKLSFWNRDIRYG